MDPGVCIIDELTQGMELARQLKSILSSESSPESKQVLIQGIISSLDRTLLIVNWVDSVSQQPPLTPPMLSQPESSVSIDESTFDNKQDKKVVSKKRKAMPMPKNQIRIATDNGLEGNTDDGYSWRKYGQKAILGAKFPRSYYRCTYRYVHNCMARKQVQRANEDPTVFEITYKGHHICNPATAPPQSPEKHKIKQNNRQQLPPPGETLSNLRENLRVNTSDLDVTVPCSFSFPSASFESMENYQQFCFSSEADNNFLNGYLPAFVSSATSASKSNYFSEWGNDLQYQDDSNLSEMISATASVTNSPLAFAADAQDCSPNYTFDNSGFFI